MVGAVTLLLLFAGAGVAAANEGGHDAPRRRRLNDDPDLLAAFLRMRSRRLIPIVKKTTVKIRVDDGDI